MRCLSRTVADQHITVRPLPRAYALEEIVDMVERHIVRLGLYDSRLRTAPQRMKLEMLPIDQKPSLGAAHLHAFASDSGYQRRLEGRGVVARIFEQNVDRVGRRPAVLVREDAG